MLEGLTMQVDDIASEVLHINALALVLFSPNWGAQLCNSNPISSTAGPES